MPQLTPAFGTPPPPQQRRGQTTPEFTGQSAPTTPDVGWKGGFMPTEWQNDEGEFSGVYSPTQVRAPSEYYGADGTFHAPSFAPQLPGADLSLTQAFGAEKFSNEQGDRFLNPMAGETAAAGMIPGLMAPGQGQQFQSQYGDALAGNMGADNLAAQAYSDFQANRPDISQDAGLNPYYCLLYTSPSPRD